MSANSHPAQVESRTETISLSVTPTEKKAVRVVAELRRVPLGEVLRHTPLAEVVAEFENHLDLKNRVVEAAP